MSKMGPKTGKQFYKDKHLSEVLANLKEIMPTLNRLNRWKKASALVSSKFECLSASEKEGWQNKANEAFNKKQLNNLSSSNTSNAAITASTASSKPHDLDQ